MQAFAFVLRKKIHLIERAAGGARSQTHNGRVCCRASAPDPARVRGTVAAANAASNRTSP